MEEETRVPIAKPQVTVYFLTSLGWNLNHGSGESQREVIDNHSEGPVNDWRPQYDTLENSKGIIHNLTNKKNKKTFIEFIGFWLIVFNKIHLNQLHDLFSIESLQTICIAGSPVMVFSEFSFSNWPGCQAGIRAIQNHSKITTRLVVELQIPRINKNNNSNVSSRHSKPL